MSGCSIMVLLSSIPWVGAGSRTAPIWGWLSVVGHNGYYVSADDLERRDPVHAGNEADYRLYPHPREPAQLSYQLLRLLAVFADVEAERAGLLYGFIVCARFFAVPAQRVEFFGNLGTGAQAAGVGVAGDQAQGLSLAVACDYDRRVRPAGALRQVQWTLEPVVLSLEGALVSLLAAPHPEGYLERLLQHLEAFFLRREGDAEPRCLLWVVAGADAEAGPPAGEHVQCGNRLDEHGRVTEVYSRHHRRQPYLFGVGRQEGKRRVAFRFVRLGTAHDRMLPQVVGHPDAVEARFLGDPADLREVLAEPSRTTSPVEAVELQSEFHDSNHSVSMLPLAWMSMCLALPAPELTYLWGTPAGTTTI